jgi:NADPH:quinone reductase-like Zn-dependent oxidoreductase
VCSTSKVELVRSLGADRVIDYTKEDLADGVRYDLILEIAGNNTPLSLLRRSLTPAGTLVLAGGEGGGQLLGGVDRQLRALLLSMFIHQKIRPLISFETRKDLQDLREFIEAGKLTPVVDRTYPLGDVPDAIRDLRASQARGKLVITV